MLKSLFGVVLTIKDDLHGVKEEVSSIKHHINGEFLTGVMDTAYNNAHSAAERTFDTCQKNLVDQWNKYRNDINEAYKKHEKLQKDYQKSIKRQQRHTDDLINVIVRHFHYPRYQYRKTH